MRNDISNLLPLTISARLQLFLIYIDDWSNFSDSIYQILFADETTLGPVTTKDMRGRRGGGRVCRGSVKIKMIED